MTDSMIILYYYWRAKYINRLIKTKKDLNKWQQKNITALINKKLSKSLFYKKYKNQPLCHLPLMNKNKMMENFDDINTVGIRLDDAFYIAQKAEKNRDFTPTISGITVGLSSGTSGKHSVFLVSKYERLKWAGIMLAKALKNSIAMPNKIAFFLRANSNLYSTLNKNKHIEFNFFDLTDNFDSNLKILNDYKPTLLTAPASVLKRIAVAQEQNKINIQPKKIFSVAEVLDPFDEDYIKHVFKQRVHQIYQCTEGFLGITKNNGKLYLNEDYIHVEKEWIDKNAGVFVPIITDFSRSTQPIIRYRLDDILIEDFSDKTPYTCLEKIEGRCDDLVYFEQYTGSIKAIFADILRRAITIINAPFREWRLIQHSFNAIELQLLPMISDNQKHLVTKSFKTICDSQHCKLPEITFSVYREEALPKKLKRIERRFLVKSINL